MIVMHKGRIVESGSTANILADPADDYTKRLLTAAPGLHDSARAPAPLGAATPVLVRVTDLSREFTVPGGRDASKLRIHAVYGVRFDLASGDTLYLMVASGSGQ